MERSAVAPILARALRRAHRSSPALRATVRTLAGAAIAAAIAVPLVRRRLGVPPWATTAAVAAGPLAVAVLSPRTRGRDVVLFTFQMWAFTIAHELPFDDPDALRERLRIRYPIVVDRILGAGELPSVRLQRALSRPGRVTPLDRVLSLVHWVWFFEPHLALLFVQARHVDRFARAARQMAATYDLGCAIYVAVPTAPPWWASEQGYLERPVEKVPAEVAADAAARAPVEVRRIMVDVGEGVWGSAWDRLYESLGGNPWAAMPSLHFATSLMAALLLAEIGPVPGALGAGYAAALAFALVYLGEHYVTDLVVGAALVVAVRRGEPLAEPAVNAVNRVLRRLERIATA
jgi:membrane-associated phospholipid phosphatase